MQSMYSFYPHKRDLIYPPGASGQFIFTNIVEANLDGNIENCDIFRQLDTNTNEFHTDRSTFRGVPVDLLRDKFYNIACDIRKQEDYSILIDFVMQLANDYFNDTSVNSPVEKLKNIAILPLDKIKKWPYAFLDPCGMMMDTKEDSEILNHKVYRWFWHWMIKNIIMEIPHNENFRYQTYVMHRPFHAVANICDNTTIGVKKYFKGYSYANIHPQNRYQSAYFTILMNAKHGTEFHINYWKKELNRLEGLNDLTLDFNHEKYVDYTLPGISFDLNYRKLFVENSADEIRRLYSYFGVLTYYKDNEDEIINKFEKYHNDNIIFLKKVYGSDNTLLQEIIDKL